MNCSKLIFAALSIIALIVSCSEPLKPIDRVTAEELAAMASSSGEAEDSSSSEEQKLADCINLNPVYEFCYNGHAYDKCGDSNGLGKYDYDPDTHFCHNNYTVAKCNGKEYNPPDERCSYGIVEGQCPANNWFDIYTDFCLDGVVTPLCGGRTFTSSQFCSGSAVYDKCGSYKYEPSTQLCYTDNTIHNKCDNQSYNPATYFCYNSSKIGVKCGTRTDEYDPDLYECKSEINPNGIYLKGDEYEAVLIGTQTWMTKNLAYSTYTSCNYDCPQNFYNWQTAMDTYSSCYESLGPKHRGICPEGWHIPSNEEWNMLMTAVGGSNTAGTKLKATTDSGTDNYGFLALPGSCSLYMFCPPETPEGESCPCGGAYSKRGTGYNWWSSDCSSNSLNKFTIGNDGGASLESIDNNYSISISTRLPVRCVMD